MEVSPGSSFGPFVLGCPIGVALNWLQRQNKVISHVELKYFSQEPLSRDIVLDLHEDGVLLRFEPHSQQLKSVEVYDVPKIKLSYSGTVFSAPDKAPTLVNIYERFGPTHPGEYEPSTQLYYLHYPGLSFSFPIPKKYESFYANADGIPPMEFPDRTTPVTSRIFLYSGTNMKSPEVPPPPQLLGKESLYFEEVLVKISHGITFTSRKCSLDFTSTTQDVLSALGPPSRIFYKEEDKMKIHTASYSGLGCADYFYNYFNLGVDILFDIHTHVIKKIVLHTNFPSHYEFNQYVKCNFKVLVGDKESNDVEDKKDMPFITADTKWSEVQAILGPAGKPVVHNGGSNTNPFGPTLFYGYKDIIFEIMKNNHIASICIWSQSNMSK